MRRLLAGTLANTLDTTVRERGTDEEPDTFVVTGDIEAMWLRDSTAQVWPYLASVRDDADLDRIIRGVVHRQATQILLDPYANAFLDGDGPSEWAADETEMRPGIHERKWEPDSLQAFLRLSAGYWHASRSIRAFDAAWRSALECSLRTLRTEQRLEGTSSYRFHRPHGDATDRVSRNGLGEPTRPNGMVHGAFRPSDDASALPMNVPVNLALAAALDSVAPLADELGMQESSATARAVAAGVRDGVARHGVVGAGADRMWAYEVDGLGAQVLMDDANAPSLLSLPYLGACDAGDPMYVATRRWILSPRNPWWFQGEVAEGIGSPHTGARRVWPMAIAIRGLTAASDADRLEAIRMIDATHAGTFLAHESVDADDPTLFTRPWFAWANALVGELLERSGLDGLLA